MIGTETVGVAAGNPRLARHRLTVDGRRVGVAVGGHGIPLVLAGGLLLAGGLYEQTLSRLAVPVALGHLGAPWRLLGPGLSALYASASAPLLDRISLAGDLGAACSRAVVDAGLDPAPLSAPFPRQPHYSWSLTRVT
jgi:hypothetical protein